MDGFWESPMYIQAQMKGGEKGDVKTKLGGRSGYKGGRDEERERGGTTTLGGGLKNKKQTKFTWNAATGD